MNMIKKLLKKLFCHKQCPLLERGRERLLSCSMRMRILLGIGVLAAVLALGFIGSRLVSTVFTEDTSVLTSVPDEVKGKIVTLRLLKEDYYIDYHNMFSVEVRKNLEFPAYITLGYTIAYLQDQQQKVDTGKVLYYCIFDNKENKLIGEVNLREKNDSDPGQFGCWINENYWGGGRFQEAIRLITKTYFRLKPMEKSFIAHVRLWNKRSYFAHKKAGFKEIGFVYEQGKATRYLLEYSRKK